MSTVEHAKTKTASHRWWPASTSTSPRFTSATRRCPTGRGPSLSEEASTCRRRCEMNIRRHDDDVAYWIVHYKTSDQGVTQRQELRRSSWVGSARRSLTAICGFPQALGGQTRIEQGYIVGAPELVIEIARSSRSYDLNEKKAEYARAGVREYVVVELDPDRVHWFILRDGRFRGFARRRDGIYRSEVFPGLVARRRCTLRRGPGSRDRSPGAGHPHTRARGLRGQADRGRRGEETAMSTVERAEPKTLLPPLVAGQHLDQPTFHERYEAMPPETRAELVGGVVYMPSPMRLDHGDTSRIVAGWFVHYQMEDTRGYGRGRCHGHARSSRRAAAGPLASNSGRAGGTDPRRRRRLPRRPARAGCRSRSLQPLVRLEPEEGRLRTGGRSRVRRCRAGTRSHPLVHPPPQTLPGFAARSRRDLSLGGLPGVVARCRGTLCRRSGPVDARFWIRAWRHPSTRPSRPSWPRLAQGRTT